MKTLSEVQLRDGRQAEILRLSAPPDNIIGPVRKWLANMDPWLWHLEQYDKGFVSGMEGHFYLARLEDRLVGNVTIFRNGVFGSVMHVFTIPDSRGLGVSRALLEAAIADFEQDSGQVLVLVATFNSFTWKLYESVGFSGVGPQDNHAPMAIFFQDAEWQDLFKCHPHEVCRLGWRHFVGTQMLFCSPGPEQLRSIHLPCMGRRLVEKELLCFRQWQTGRADSNAWVIQGQGACVLGFATIGQHPMWGEFGRRKVLDLYVHPSGMQMSRPLLKAVLENSSEPVECYCDSTAEQKIALLRDSGFQESRVPSAFRYGDQLLDLVIMVN